MGSSFNYGRMFGNPRGGRDSGRQDDTASRRQVETAPTVQDEHRRTQRTEQDAAGIDYPQRDPNVPLGRDWRDIVHHDSQHEKRIADYHRYHDDVHSYDFHPEYPGSLKANPVSAEHFTPYGTRKNITVPSLTGHIVVIAFTDAGVVTRTFQIFSDTDRVGRTMAWGMTDEQWMVRVHNTLRTINQHRRSMVDRPTIYVAFMNAPRFRDYGMLMARTLEQHITPRTRVHQLPYPQVQRPYTTRNVVIVDVSARTVSVRPTWMRNADHVSHNPEWYGLKQEQRHLTFIHGVRPVNII